MCMPVFIEQAALAIVSPIISAFLKNEGEAAVAAVNLIEMLHFTLQQILISMGTALTVVISQYRGKGDKYATGKVAVQGLGFSIVFAIVLAILGLGMQRRIITLLLRDAEEAVYYFGIIYYRMCILCLPFIACYAMTTAAVRGSGKPKYALFAAVVNNGCYILFAFISTILKGGIYGIGIAMILARICAAVIGLFFFKHGNENLYIERLIPKKIELSVIRPLTLISIPLCLESLLYNGGKLVTQTFSIPFGTNATAANGIINSLNSVLIIPGAAAQIAVTPIVGRYMGEGNLYEAKRMTKLFLIITTFFMTISCIGLYFSVVPIAYFYSESSEIVDTIIEVTRISCCIIPFLWTTSFVLPGAMKGSGDVNYSSIISVISMVLMRICGGYFFLLFCVWE